MTGVPFTTSRAPMVKRLGHRSVGRIVQHQDQGNTGALVAFRLDHRRYADPGFSKNARNFGKRPRHVDYVETHEIA